VFNVGGGELIVILVLGLILLGPDRLPEVARELGKHLATYHRLRDGFTTELRDAMDLTVADNEPSAATPVAVASHSSVAVSGPDQSFA
jgi:Tat protein translocase TatB subunit